MKSLEKFEKRIIQEKILSDRITDKLESAVYLFKYPHIIQTLEEVAFHSKEMFEQYETAIFDLETFSFREVGNQFIKEFLSKSTHYLD
jgi:hypothetical protein